MLSRFRILSFITVLLAAAGLTLAALLDGVRLPSDAAGYFFWAVLVGLSDFMSFDLGVGLLAMDLPLLLAAACVFGPFYGGVMGFVASLDPREFRRAVTFSNSIFNRAQVCLAVLAAGFVFQGFNVNSRDWPALLGATGVALAADVVINCSFVIAAYAQVEDASWYESGLRLMRGFKLDAALLYALFGLLAALFVGVYRGVGTWGLALFAIPLVLARQAMLRAREIEKKERELRSTQAALQRISEKIAEERYDERTRIAGALHDDVLQALQSVQLHAQVVRQDLRWGRLLAAEQDADELILVTEQAGQSMRQAVRELRSSPLGRHGVSETLRLLIDQLRDQTSTQIEYELLGITAEPSQQLLLYQIAKEAVFNAVQHSLASTVRVSLRQERGNAVLIVTDDGIGFEVGSALKGHFGLELMRERGTLGGGHVHVTSVPGVGTTVVANLPLRGRALR
jgi:signal transduction histidine kinase